MPTPEQLIDALDRHPDFKRDVLDLLLKRSKLAGGWDWKPTEESFGNLMGMYFRRGPWDRPLANIYFNSEAVWHWMVFDPFTGWARRGQTPPRLAEGKEASAREARKRVDEWLEHSEWTLVGGYAIEEPHADAA